MNAPGQDGEEPPESPPIKKPDNKIKMAEDLTAEEQAIITSLDRINERYQAIVAEKYEALADLLKKKVPPLKVNL
jgi:hypothetical protein